jgi:hypothetical protein
MSNDRTVDDNLVEIYLSDHAAAAAAMTRRIRRMAAAYDRELAAAMAELADALERERNWILSVMEGRQLTLSRWKTAATVVGERIGRLKRNGRSFQQSPLSPLLELELLGSGLRGKRSGWRTLLEWSTELQIDTDELNALLADVERQIEKVEELLVMQRRKALRRT